MTAKLDSSWFKHETRAKPGFGKRRLALIAQMRQEEITLDHHIISYAASYMSAKAQAEQAEERELTEKGLDALRIELLECTNTKDTTHISKLGPLSDAISSAAKLKAEKAWAKKARAERKTDHPGGELGAIADAILRRNTR